MSSDEDEDMQDYLGNLAGDVRAVRSNTIGGGSRKGYRTSSAKMISWFYQHKREIREEAFIEAVVGDDRTRAMTEAGILETLAASDIPPINFTTFKAQDFMLWIVSLRKNNGEKPGKATYDSHRSALFNLFRDFGATYPADTDSEIKNHYLGLKRSTATRIAEGNGRIKVGKDPLPFTLYRYMGLRLLGSAASDAIFALVFMIISWCLMCRCVILKSVSKF